MKVVGKEFRPVVTAENPWTAERVKRLRGKRTQEQFGKLVGVPKNTVWRWEAGYSRPDAKRSRRLARLAKMESFKRGWKLEGSAALLGDLEEGSREIAKLFKFSPIRLARTKV